MQDITPIISGNKKIIEAYGNGGFKITGERLEGNIIILPDSVHRFESANIETASGMHLEAILNNADDIEVLLVGGGQSTEFFNTDIENLLRSKGISTEYMDTGAAARTYNVLLSEERKVAVVLIAV
jgi:uncharacterized protein